VRHQRDVARWRSTAKRRRPCCLTSASMLIPVQVVRTSRRLVFRLLAWNPWQAVFLRGFEQLRAPLQC
jgi:hypothetical protein